MINQFRSFVFSFFLLFSCYSFSAPYTFYSPSHQGLDSSSVSQVCTKIKALYPYYSPLSGIVSVSHYWQCVFGTTTQIVYKRGDSCPIAGETLNTQTGECVPPPPPCKVGDLFPSKGSTGAIVVGSNGVKYVPSQPRTMCQNRCEYSDPSARPSGCYAVSATEGFCNYIIKGTGQNCSSDSYEFSTSGSPLNPPDTPNVPDSSPEPLCPTGWAVSSGTCYKLPPKPCDPSTGAVCAPGTTDPDAKPPAPGAGGTAGTPSEGTGGRPDSSSGADADLEPLKGSKPDAEPCKPKADGSGCGGPTVKGEQCDKDIVCTGDAVQCAILRQSKKNACDSEYPDARPFIEQQIAKDAYKLTTNEVNGGSLFSAGLNAPRWLPASCPAPKPISIKGVSTSLSFEPACQFASSLGPLFVALAGVFFAVYVGRAFGGS